MEDEEKTRIDEYSQFLTKNNYLQYLPELKGMPIYGPELLYLRNELFSTIEKFFIEEGFKRMEYPLIGCESFLEKEASFMEGFDPELFKLQEGGYLRPTSEAIIYESWNRKRISLPKLEYQIVDVYRKETKSTRPLIRGRQVHFFEAHTLHSTKEEALKTYNRYQEIMKKVILEIGLNSTLEVVRPIKDTFPGAIETTAIDFKLNKNTYSQAATAHYYGTNFAKSFNLKTGQDYLFQTTFGFSDRLLGLLLIQNMENGSIKRLKFDKSVGVFRRETPLEDLYKILPVQHIHFLNPKKMKSEIENRMRIGMDKFLFFNGNSIEKYQNNSWHVIEVGDIDEYLQTTPVDTVKAEPDTMTLCIECQKSYPITGYLSTGDTCQECGGENARKCITGKLL